MRPHSYIYLAVSPLPPHRLRDLRDGGNVEAARGAGFKVDRDRQALTTAEWASQAVVRLRSTSSSVTAHSRARAYAS
jgi:hypothetical protein